MARKPWVCGPDCPAWFDLPQMLRGNCTIHDNNSVEVGEKCPFKKRDLEGLLEIFTSCGRDVRDVLKKRGM